MTREEEIIDASGRYVNRCDSQQICFQKGAKWAFKKAGNEVLSNAQIEKVVCLYTEWLLDKAHNASDKIDYIQQHYGEIR